MHDILDYMRARSRCTGSTTRTSSPSALLYAWHENFVLPLSHDEVVHGKGSLARPGCPATTGRSSPASGRSTGSCTGTRARSTSFMGGELGQVREWNHDTSLDWHLLDQGPYHRGVQAPRPGPEPPVPGRAGAPPGRLRARRLSVDGLLRRRAERGGLRPPRARSPGPGARRVQLHARCRARVTASACPSGASTGSSEHRRRVLRRQQHGQRGRGPGGGPAVDRRSRGRSRSPLPPLSVVMLKPGPGLIYSGTRAPKLPGCPGPEGRIDAARPRSRPDPRRRERLAPRAPDARAQQARGAVRRALPHRRLRPLELRQLPDPLALRPRPVHVAVADRAPPDRVADQRPGAGPLHRGRAAADADRRGVVPRQRGRRPPEPATSSTTSTPIWWPCSGRTTSTAWT